MERKIGEVFQYGDTWLEVVSGLFCTSCYLKVGNMCVAERRLTGECLAKKREDKRNIIFEKTKKPKIKKKKGV